LSHIDELEVIWPGGQHQKAPSPAIDCVMVIRQE